jgi:hypothetical protein
VDMHGVLAETYRSSINCNVALTPETGGDFSLKRFHQLKEEAIAKQRPADDNPPKFLTSWKGIPTRETLAMMGVEMVDDEDFGDEPGRG